MTRSKPKKSDPVDGLEVDATYTQSYWDVDMLAGEHINASIKLLSQRILDCQQLGRTNRATTYANIRSRLMQLRREWRDLDMNPKVPKQW